MEALLAHCATTFSQTGGMFAVFFLGGLMGSLTHCLVMCGPLVACQSACGGGCGKRMSSASQWQYHVGRLLTYGAFGFFAAWFGKQLAAISFWPTLSAAMMIAAGGLFIGSSLLRHPREGGDPLTRKNSLSRIDSRLRGNDIVKGALMSFMPCGLIYAALMMAATLASPLAGMVAMWLFVLGTIPALLIASGGAAMLAIKWQDMMRGIGRFGLAFNGLTLLVMAARSIK